MDPNKQHAGRVGVHAMMAKYGTGYAPAKMRDAKWKKLLNEVDPQSMLNEVERNKRATMLQKSRMIAMSKLGVEAKRAKAAEKSNKMPAIDTIAPTLDAINNHCAWCGPIDRMQSHQTCEKHAAEFLAYQDRKQ